MPRPAANLIAAAALTFLFIALPAAAETCRSCHPAPEAASVVPAEIPPHTARSGCPALMSLLFEMERTEKILLALRNDSEAPGRASRLRAADRYYLAVSRRVDSADGFAREMRDLRERLREEVVRPRRRAERKRSLYLAAALGAVVAAAAAGLVWLRRRRAGPPRGQR